MELTTTHYISLILVLLLSFVPGWYVARIKSADDYNVGGRKSSVVLVAGGIFSTGLPAERQQLALHKWLLIMDCVVGGLLLNRTFTYLYGTVLC